MKKKLFLLSVIVSVSSLCFAQQTSTPSKTNNSTVSTQVSGSTTVSTSAGTKTFTGKVSSVSIGDTMAVTKSKITARDDNGQESTFTVTADTTVTGKDGYKTTLDWIGKDNKVTIEYATTEKGDKTAKSIKMLADW